ncbi:MAG: DMT family transporter [Chloroflexi bacterium]|nr:DMT family transporter [Chloroflexota bacterium]
MRATATTWLSAATSRSHSARLRAYAALGLGAVCIGFSAIFTKWAIVPGPVSAFYRVAIASVALALPLALHVARQQAKGPALLPGDAKRKMSSVGLALTALAGLFFALDLGFWNTSLAYTSAADSTLLGNISTLWVALGALLLFHEQLKRRFWSGMLLALVGAAVVVGRDAFEGATLGLGDLLAVGSSLFYASYMLCTQRARRYVSTLPFMWVSSAVATLFLLAYLLVVGDPLSGFSAQTYLALLSLGLVSHVLGWLSINYALGHLPASITAVTLLLQPVITALVAVPLLSENLSFYQIGGGVLVLLGVYIVNKR